MIFLLLLAIPVIWFVFRPFRDKTHISNMEKKCVFVTGCDSGFGLNLAKSLDSMGVPVFAGCYTDSGIEHLKEQCSDKIQPLKIDISNTASIEKALEYVKNNIPPGAGLWGLVNNAGMSSSFSRFDFTNKRQWETTFAVNVFGMTDVTLHFLPLIKESKGRVVNMCSGSGRIGLQIMPVYSSSKFAVRGFTDALRRDMNIWGVKVIQLEPGFYATDLCVLDNIVAGIEKDYNNSPSHTQQQYGQEWLKEAKNKITAMLTKGTSKNLGEVSDAYVDALFSKEPLTKYFPGTLVRQIISRLMGVLPDSFSDKLLSSLNKGLTPSALER